MMDVDHVDWEFETAVLAPNYAALQVALADVDGHLTGSTLPVIPVSLDGVALVVVVPHNYVTWLPPVLFALTDGDGSPSADGQRVTGAYIVLGPDAAHAMSRSDGSSGWVEDGRWPATPALVAGLENLAADITAQQVVTSRNFLEGSLPPTDLTVGPMEIDLTFQGGLGAGRWSGLLSVPWPPPEPLAEPPHDPTDVDGEADDGGRGRPSTAPVPLMPNSAHRPVSDLTRPSVAAREGKGGKAVGKTPTQNQRINTLAEDVQGLSAQMASLADLVRDSLQAKQTAASAPAESPAGPVVRDPFMGIGNPYLRSPPPPTSSNPFLAPRVGAFAGTSPPPLAGTMVTGYAGPTPLHKAPSWSPPQAGMMGPALTRPSAVGQAGSTIFGGSSAAQMDGGQASRNEVMDMIRSVVAEIGGPPSVGVGRTSPPPADQPVGRDEIRMMIQDLLPDRNQPSLTADAGDLDTSGARGAVAYAREKQKFENNPDQVFVDFRNKARRILGRHGSSPTAFSHLMTELPFGTMNNRKRMALVLLTVLDEMEMNNAAMARGLVVQALRWIILDLENPRDSLTSWRLTYLPDPVPLTGPTRASAGLDLNHSLLCPAQLTATLGMSRDMELLTKRIKGMKDEDGVRPPKAGKDDKGPNAKKGGGKGDGG